MPKKNKKKDQLNLLFDITIYCHLHLQQILEKSKKEENEKKIMEIQSIIKLIIFLENKIPQSLRLGQTFFTQLVIVGDFVQHQNEIVSHFDEDDIISCIITLGEPRYGGETMYYNGVTQVTSSDIEIKLPFQHCRLQIGSFNKIFYGVSPWVGPRLTLNFNLKKKLLIISNYLVINIMANMKKMVFRNIPLIRILYIT